MDNPNNINRMVIRMRTRRDILNDIMEQLVDIMIIEYDYALDKKYVGAKYSNHITINSVIKKVFPLCIKDYEYDIIRDEVYASAYEVMMTKVAPDFTNEQLEQILEDIHTKKLDITNKFLVAIYKLAIFKVKLNLSGYRRNSNGMIPAADELEYSEGILNDSPNYNYGLYIDNPDEDISFFTSWFNENRAGFLTEKQLQFVEDDSSIDSKNKSSYKKRIYQKTLKAYQAEFQTNDDKLNEIRTQILTIERLLDSENFPEDYLRLRDKSFIIDAITSYVSLPILKAFNLGSRDAKVIKEIRTALFFKLRDLNNLIPQN